MTMTLSAGSSYGPRALLNLYAETAFHDTTSWVKPRTLQDMPSFLEHYNPKVGSSLALSSASKNPGSPHTLVITSAGLRAADITRWATPVKPKSCESAEINIRTTL